MAPDVGTEWAIESEDGRLLRCVLLYWKDSPGHMQVNLSQAPRWAKPCPRHTQASRLT